MCGLSGRDLPVYDWHRPGHAAPVPGYRLDELKGAQGFAARATLRHRLFGELRAFARAGAGNVFGRRRDMTLRDLRWGVGLGAYQPTAIGPVSLEVAVRDGGDTLLSLAVGWN
jgi:hypothetical protein